MTVTPENPIGLDGFEFVEFTSPDPAKMAALIEQLGFTAYSKHPTKAIVRYKQGRTNLLVNQDADGQATCRTIWPFAMAFFQTSRVLVAWCELRQDFRHFRADRVDCLRTTGERYPTHRHVLLQRWRDQMQYETGCL